MRAVIDSIRETVMVREIRRIIHDRNLFLIVLLAPVFYLFFYGTVYRNNVIHSLKLGVIDADHTSFSRLMLRQMKADPVLKIHPYATEPEAIEAIHRQRIDAYLIIPAKSEDRIKKGESITIPLADNSACMMVNNEASKRVNQIIQYLNTVIGAGNWMVQGANQKAAVSRALPITTQINPISNPGYGYANFILIGLFLLIIQQLLLMATAESMAKENQESTLPDLMAAAQNNPVRLIIGKSAPYLIFFGVYYIFTAAVVMPVMGLTMAADWLELILAMIPFLLVVIEIGFLIGSFFQNKIQALQILAITSVPVFLLCGFSWPFYTLPLVIKVISYTLPSYFIMASYQSMTLMGASVGHNLHYWLVLWVQAGIYGIILYRRLQFLRTDRVKKHGTDQ
ncbi:MAG: ABC transporter permease [Candidatus Delongbacteria bacterium]|nr:ABC transporter permease [Candidatus Delongbacteria bacterium]